MNVEDYLADTRPVAQSISRKAFESECAAVQKAILKKDPPSLVPNPDDLRIGDIILTRSTNRSVTKTPNPIERTQLERGFEKSDAFWTHVALYVGDLHVLEAQAIKDRNILKSAKAATSSILAGVQLRPITDYTDRSYFKIVRHKAKAFNEVRIGIARYGLLDHAVNKRRYGHRRALEALRFDSVSKKHVPRLHKEVICSELVLECLAIGGKVLVGEFDSLRNGRRFFFPADYSAHGDFQEIKVSMLKIEDDAF